MRTLDLECPACGEMLELDAGFAGGVCRCSTCGTLMTVPADAGAGAQRLSRPGSAGGAGSRSGGSSIISPGDLVSTGRSRRSGPRRKPTKRGRSGSRSAPVEAGEYRTATGQVIRIDQTTRVPMAQGKRRQVRMATTIIFMSIVLGVAAVGAIAVWAMINSNGQAQPPGRSGDDGPVGGAPTAPPPIYDAQANPFLLAFPNAAGLPVAGRVAVVVEASDQTESWAPAVGEMLRVGLRRSGGRTQVAVFAAGPGGTAAFDAGAITPGTQINAAMLDTYFDQLEFGGGVDMTAAIDDALAVKPDMLILVISSAPANRVDEWAARFEAAAQTTVHTVLIDGYSSPLRDLMRERRGSRLVTLTSDAVRDWKQESEAAQ